MTEPNRDYLSGNNAGSQQLPNATATLVLGILSIVVCLICGIVALVISNKDVALYKANPELYSAASYNNIKAGRICALIGIILQGLAIIVYIIFIAFFISVASSSGFR
ncbi:MAG: hypothetical protein JNM14_13585 [Ferruginibacter sp.]|nr:hypothetical protein [Ferruginibacter sp.]